MITKKVVPRLASSSPDLQRVLQTIYDDLNAIVDQINKEAQDNPKTQAGTVGEVRVVKTGNNAYRVQVRSSEGWVYADNFVPLGE